MGRLLQSSVGCEAAGTAVEAPLRGAHAAAAAAASDFAVGAHHSGATAAAAAALAAAGAQAAASTAAAAQAEGLHGEVLRELQQQQQQQHQRQKPADTNLLLFLRQRGSSSRLQSLCAAAAAHATRWVLAGIRALRPPEKKQHSQRWLRLTIDGLRKKSSSSSSSPWQLLSSGLVAAAAAAAAAMAAAPVGGGLLAGRGDAAAAAAPGGSIQGWIASTALQCSSSAVSFWGVCAAGGRLQQTLGISCASLLSKPLGLLTVAVASNAAAAAAAVAGFVCNRVQQLHASSSGGGWLGAARELQQETRGKWGGLLLQHHPRTSVAAGSSYSNSSSVMRSKSWLSVFALEALEGLFLFYLLGGGLFRLSPSSLVYPGAFAVRGLSLSATAGYATETERRLIRKVGSMHGCHSCGIRSSSTKWIADHQPPTARVIKYEATTLGRLRSLLRRSLGGPRCWPQRLYPHCEVCSLKQAAAVRRLTAGPPSTQVVAAAAAAGSAAAKSLAERTQRLAQRQLVYRWRSCRLWHFTGGFLALFSCARLLCLLLAAEERALIAPDRGPCVSVSIAGKPSKPPSSSPPAAEFSSGQSAREAFARVEVQFRSEGETLWIAWCSV
ncbi:hypothetical protein Efla_005326 [Eimeria flavescens]